LIPCISRFKASFKNACDIKGYQNLVISLSGDENRLGTRAEKHCILKFNEVPVFAQLNCFQIQAEYLVVGFCQEVAALFCGYVFRSLCVHLVKLNSLKMLAERVAMGISPKRWWQGAHPHGHPSIMFTVGTSGKFKMSEMGEKLTDRH